VPAQQPFFQQEHPSEQRMMDRLSLFWQPTTIDGKKTVEIESPIWRSGRLRMEKRINWESNLGL
jgi:hypothetical protein